MLHTILISQTLSSLFPLNSTSTWVSSRPLKTSNEGSMGKLYQILAMISFFTIVTLLMSLLMSYLLEGTVHAT